MENKKVIDLEIDKLQKKVDNLNTRIEDAKKDNRSYAHYKNQLQDPLARLDGLKAFRTVMTKAQKENDKD